MRLSLRFIIPLLASLALLAYAAVPLADKLMLSWFMRDLDIRSSLIATTAEETLIQHVRTGSRNKILGYLNRLNQDERLFAIGVCDTGQKGLVATTTFPKDLRCHELDRYANPEARLFASPQGPLYVAVSPLQDEAGLAGRLVIMHDMSFVQRRTEETKRYIFYFFIAVGLVVSLITVVIAQLSWRGWVQGTRSLLRGEGLLRPIEQIHMPELRPIARDIGTLIRELKSEYRARDESQLAWTPEALRAILRQDLRGENVVVVSNREPYIHVRCPASGLVAAVEREVRRGDFINSAIRLSIRWDQAF